MKKIHYTDNYLLKPYHPVTIHVAGAGGTGSQVIANLARMNVALQALGHPGRHPVRPRHRHASQHRTPALQ